MENTFKPTISLIGEDTLLKESVEVSRLFIEISTNRISYAILNNNTQTYKAIESFTFADNTDFNDICNRLDSIYSISEILKNDYLSVNVLFNGYKSTLIPNVLFNKENPGSYLKFNYNIDNEEEVAYDHLTITEATNIYTINQLLSNKIKILFPKAKIAHSYSSLIENLLYQFANIKASKLILHVQQKYIQIIHICDSKLVFFNTFSYNTKEDFIYYILFVMQQLHLNPETQELLVLGEIEKKTSLSEILFQYIKNPVFGEKSTKYKFDIVFDDIPPHHFYNLLNFHI